MVGGAKDCSPGRRSAEALGGTRREARYLFFPVEEEGKASKWHRLAGAVGSTWNGPWAFAIGRTFRLDEVDCRGPPSRFGRKIDVGPPDESRRLDPQACLEVESESSESHGKEKLVMAPDSNPTRGGWSIVASVGFHVEHRR